MFKFGDVELRKLSAGDVHILTELKQTTWQSTHRTSILNSEDQINWYSSLDSDIHQPTSLVLVAEADFSYPTKLGPDYVHHVRFGVFKISNVDWVSRSADVGWDVVKERRGLGYGKKLVRAGSAFCFEVLNLRRLSCEILENNLASQKVAAHSGYGVEGRKKEAVFKEGLYYDSLICGLLSRTWNLLIEKNFGEQSIEQTG